jgi:hypothetical protein
MKHDEQTIQAAEHHVEIFRWVPADLEERTRTAFLAGAEYAFSRKLNWHTFTSDRSSDPIPGMLIVFICGQPLGPDPKVMFWQSDIEVIEGDQWIYLNDILPQP